MEQTVKQISDRFPCREDVIRQLYRFYGDGDPFPPAVYLYGHTSTGKTSILREFLSHHLEDTKCAFLNAIECYTNKILFETILNRLTDHVPSADNGYASVASADCMRDFVGHLSHLLDEELSYVVVVENAERIRDMDHNVLPMLLRLPEVCGLNLSVVLVSDLPFEKYFVRTGLSPVIKVFVAEYSKKDITAIMKGGFEKVREEIRINLEQMLEE